MRAATRLRTQIDVIASESLKGVMFFEIGHQNWGKAAEGAALGTDGKVVKVRYNYVDWVIPQTDAKVRMGLQNFSVRIRPSPTSSSSAAATPTARASPYQHPVHRRTSERDPLLAARRKRQRPRQRHRYGTMPLQRRHGLHRA